MFDILRLEYSAINGIIEYHLDKWNEEKKSSCCFSLKVKKKKRIKNNIFNSAQVVIKIKHNDAQMTLKKCPSITKGGWKIRKIFKWMYWR